MARGWILLSMRMPWSMAVAGSMSLVPSILTSWPFCSLLTRWWPTAQPTIFSTLSLVKTCSRRGLDLRPSSPSMMAMLFFSSTFLMAALFCCCFMSC